jgi:hypothetical protein
MSNVYMYIDHVCTFKIHPFVDTHFPLETLAEKQVEVILCSCINIAQCIPFFGLAGNLKFNHFLYRVLIDINYTVGEAKASSTHVHVHMYTK